MADIYWPQDQWVALATMVFVIVVAVGLRGFISRIAVFVGLIFGYLLSWLLDRMSGRITSFDPVGAAEDTDARPGQLGGADGVKAADWFGFPPQTTVVQTAGRSPAGTCRTSSWRSSCSCSRP